MHEKVGNNLASLDATSLMMEKPLKLTRLNVYCLSVISIVSRHFSVLRKYSYNTVRYHNYMLKHKITFPFSRKILSTSIKLLLSLFCDIITNNYNFTRYFCRTDTHFCSRLLPNSNWECDGKKCCFALARSLIEKKVHRSLCLSIKRASSVLVLHIFFSTSFNM